MGDLSLYYSCISRSSHEMELVVSHLSTNEDTTSMTEMSNDNFDYAMSLLGGKFLQTQIDRSLSEAPVKCPHNSKYDLSASADEYILFSDAKNEHILLVSC